MPDTPIAATPAADPSDSPPRKPTLLLVDDEPSVLSALRRLFRMNGFATEQATSGAEGLELLRDEPVDLVISDMRMPEMDGAAFLEQVRQQHPECVRILLTGYSDIGSTVAAINRGEIHRYIAKPWDDNDLLLVVSEALKRRDLETQNTALVTLTQRQNNELQGLNTTLQQLNQTLEQRVASRTAELEQINGMLEQAYEEVNHSFTMAVTVFSGLLELRQSGIAGHARRVGELARRTAKKLGLAEHEQHDIHLAGLLHDIGKIGFNDEMLGKPVSAYSAEELSRYQRHPVDGETALMPLDKLHRAAQIVRQHHERMDGRGFPDGLVGPDITIGARILAAASDYDGLAHGLLAQRSYTTAHALDALRAGREKIYDPEVLPALFAAVAEIEADQSTDIELPVQQLRPQMVLARDLLSPKGAILLAKGYKFDAGVIKKVNEFAVRTGARLNVHVLAVSVEDSRSALAQTAGAAA